MQACLQEKLFFFYVIRRMPDSEKEPKGGFELGMAIALCYDFLENSLDNLQLFVYIKSTDFIDSIIFKKS